MSLLAGCSHDMPQISPSEPLPEIANPASQFCVEKGGTLEIQKNEIGEVGICHFPNGSSCEEWTFFRGECTPKDSVR